MSVTDQRGEGNDERDIEKTVAITLRALAALFGCCCCRRGAIDEIEAADDHQRQHQHTIGEIGQMRAEQETRGEQRPEDRIAEAFLVRTVAQAERRDGREQCAHEDIDVVEGDHVGFSLSPFEGERAGVRGPIHQHIAARFTLAISAPSPCPLPLKGERVILGF